MIIAIMLLKAAEGGSAWLLLIPVGFAALVIIGALTEKDGPNDVDQGGVK